jgi:hypothetical protein
MNREAIWRPRNTFPFLTSTAFTDVKFGLLTVYDFCKMKRSRLFAAFLAKQA